MTTQPWPFRAPNEHGIAENARAAAERNMADERARAVRTVAGCAHDRSDFLLLLSVLGLRPTDSERNR